MSDNPAGVEDALNRILESSIFRASARSTAFLRFVVTETLEGRASRLKAFTIATSVFGRDEAFDPQTNPIVRVEAMRLRKMIEAYYLGEGAGDPLQIRIHRGSYVPEFVAASDTSAIPADTGEPNRARSWPQALFGMTGRLAALALVVGLAAILWLASGRQRPGDGPPPGVPRHTITITVSPFTASDSAPELKPLATEFSRKIEDALSRFDYPVVVHGETGPMAIDYQLAGTLSTNPAGALMLSVRVIHAPTHEIIWNGAFDAGLPPVGSAVSASEPMVEPTQQIVSTVAQTYGLIASDMRRRVQADPNTYAIYVCIDQAYAAMNKPTDAAFRAARDCLEKVIGDNPLDAPAHAALSYLFVSAYLDGLDARPEQKPLERALALARTAVDLAPQKARPRAALFWSRIFSGRFDDAFDSTRQIIEMNPNASDNLTRIGAAQILRGRLDEGIANLRKAKALGISASGLRDLFMALAAYEGGDIEVASRHVAPETIGRFPLGLVLRIAIAQRHGDTAGAQAIRVELERDFPRFAADLPASLDRFHMMPIFRDQLLADIAIPRPSGAEPNL